jgi:hypothetical protein
VTRAERIRAWCEREFAAERVDEVFNRMLDVATGAVAGNTFEREALERIFGTCPECGEFHYSNAHGPVYDPQRWGCERCEIAWEASGQVVWRASDPLDEGEGGA